jgi:hypothetical protein
MLTFTPDLIGEGAGLRFLIEEIFRLNWMKVVDVEGFGCPEVSNLEQIRRRLVNPRRQRERNPP